MLAKRDVSHYWKLGYAQAGVGAAILFCSFVAGVAARYDAAQIHALVPYYVGILLLIEGLTILYAAKSGKRWPLAVWLAVFALQFLVMAGTFFMTRVEGAEHYAKYPCWTEFNVRTQGTRCTCGTEYMMMLVVSGASTIEPCVRAQNTLFIMSNCIYAFTFIGLIISMVTFVMACNDTCCVSCRRTASVPQFIIPGEGGQQGTMAVGLSETIVTYRTDQQPSSSNPEPYDE